LEAPELGSEDGVMPHEISPGKPSTRRYSDAEKQRAVRAVRQLRKELGHDHGTVRRVADQLGIGVESVRQWVKQAEIDDGERPGTTSQEAAELKALRQEVKELRRANAILRSASAFFAAELDRPQR
jgi:transposase-like protein